MTLFLLLDQVAAPLYLILGAIAALNLWKRNSRLPHLAPQDRRATKRSGTA